MPVLYTVAELLAATGGRGQKLPEDGVSGLSIDSRDIPPDGLFVAIKGDRLDAHDFVPAALDAGAGLAMVSEARAADWPNEPLLIVPDVLAGLGDLARQARERSAARVVAVTGSAGKTTTKEAIRLGLQGAGEVHASVKSFNNHWGVPLMLARMPQSAAFGVFELGMNHAGEITPLSEMVRPHVAVITTVGAAHLEAFASVDDIALAKGEIFCGLTPAGTAVLNADHAHLALLLREAERHGVEQVVTYGFAAHADVRLTDPRAAGEGMAAKLLIDGQQFDLGVQSPGRHMLANAAAAVAVAMVLGLDLQPVVKNLSRFGAPEGRGQVHRLGPKEAPLVVIDESYNANPASMRAALEVFASRPKESGSKVLVLGDMRELGADSAMLHAQLAGDVAATGADRIFLVGAHMQALAAALGPERVTGQSPDVAGIGDQVLNGLAKGDMVMVKGSNGVGLSSLVLRIREAFGEPEVSGEAGKGA